MAAKNQEPSATDLALGLSSMSLKVREPKSQSEQDRKQWDSSDFGLRISFDLRISDFGFRRQVIFENRLTRDLLKGFAFIQGQSLWPT